MFLAYFALWVILNGRWTAEIAAFGVVFAALLYAFSCAFLGYSVRADLRLMRGLPRALRYGVMLLCEIVKANFAVMRVILSPKAEVRPKLVRFESGLSRESLRVALADSITLTPGTITCQLRGDEFVVHCLDASMAEGLTDGPLITALRAMEAPRKAEAAEEAAPDEIVIEETAAEIVSEEAATEEPAAETEPEETAADGGEKGADGDA